MLLKWKKEKKNKTTRLSTTAIYVLPVFYSQVAPNECCNDTRSAITAVFPAAMSMYGGGGFLFFFFFFFLGAGMRRDGREGREVEHTILIECLV